MGIFNKPEEQKVTIILQTVGQDKYISSYTLEQFENYLSTCGYFVKTDDNEFVPVHKIERVRVLTKP